MLIPHHIQSRSQFVEEAWKLCPTKSAQRAIREGRVTMLGGFSDIPPLGRPGFICYVRHGRTWLLALIEQLDRSFRGVYVENVPWKNRVSLVPPSQWTLSGGDPLPAPRQIGDETLAKLRAAAKATRLCPPDRHTQHRR
ncbi:hypothetical protein LCGC14_0911910 [marine sediment metagenome]|uniref:Uncharacterized protein n=1 Tax=marine sediment metagenome TaxID=412755 RepID=A0A0F9NTC0_9ZZZZ